MNQAPNKVVGELEEVRAIITRPENILIHMAANLDTLTPQGYRNTVIVHFSGNIGLEMELRNMLLYLPMKRERYKQWCKTEAGWGSLKN